MYSWDKGIHGIFVNLTENNAATWIVYQFSPNKTLSYANPMKLLFHLPWMMYILNNHVKRYMLIYLIIYIKSQIISDIWQYEKSLFTISTRAYDCAVSRVYPVYELMTLNLRHNYLSYIQYLALVQWIVYGFHPLQYKCVLITSHCVCQ